MDTARILAAARFAARCHHGQTRKGSGNIPYVDHVLDVAERLARVHPDDKVLILGGLLHDTVEDSDATEAQIANLFGADVAALVAEVTDDMSLPGDERRKRQEEHVARASDRAKRLKLADKAANLVAIARTPPDWSAERMGEYVDWALRVIDPVRGLDARLEAAFDDSVDEVRAAIAAKR